MGRLTGENELLGRMSVWENKCYEVWGGFTVEWVENDVPVREVNATWPEE